MASAMLSVLYQYEFSIYDVRVCDMLEKKYKTKKYHKIKNWTFEKLWLGYEEYLKKILELFGKSNYREADKHLWEKSFYEQLEKDLRMKISDISLLPVDFNKHSPDNQILTVALKFKSKNPILLTSDNGLQIKAKGLKITTITLKEFLGQLKIR